MATDYDSPRKTDDELTEDSLQELQARRMDKSATAIDVDADDVAESLELPGADLSNEELSIRVVPRPLHVVVVVMENHAFNEIIGTPQARYVNSLARRGALLTRSYAVTHPSEPNYLALFSGSTHGVSGDPCPTTLNAPNLAADLIGKHLTFAGYAEGLPAPGSQVCWHGEYARKHVPWTDFRNVPAGMNLPFSSFPQDFAQLPTVSFVIPNLCSDMHDCPVATGDAWLRTHIDRYAQWAMTHDSLLIVTF